MRQQADYTVIPALVRGRSLPEATRRRRHRGGPVRIRVASGRSTITAANHDELPTVGGGLRYRASNNRVLGAIRRTEIFWRTGPRDGEYPQPLHQTVDVERHHPGSR
jgi:hypothetical protein